MLSCQAFWRRFGPFSFCVRRSKGQSLGGFDAMISRVSAALLTHNSTKALTTLTMNLLTIQPN